MLSSVWASDLPFTFTRSTSLALATDCSRGSASGVPALQKVLFFKLLAKSVHLGSLTWLASTAASICPRVISAASGMWVFSACLVGLMGSNATGSTVPTSWSVACWTAPVLS